VFGGARRLTQGHRRVAREKEESKMGEVGTGKTTWFHRPGHGHSMGCPSVQTSTLCTLYSDRMLATLFALELLIATHVDRSLVVIHSVRLIDVFDQKSPFRRC
jgi:hypothetical protein